ncbi:zinc-binding alcohol dehydrogenase [Paenibacillus sp.]|jgi:threonine dehydrogenase-like Zn-dependent dehydrogenase|uniref:zinc-dependent alcohol dehydrogenase n=1 Tax=Paenibacillus sp. TaxID=58172 RepID=UPI0028396F92|nr:zinc-binding alcohol dehydrogenase [Paenibacillus sp.]MDR0270473.1 zinc-binding alcohol dehydrogenase [Paenibacillus sp.]
MKTITTQKGNIIIAEREKPELLKGHVLVRTTYSAISPGTEMIFVRQASAEPVTLGYNAVGIVEQVGEGVTHIKAGQLVACYGAPYVHHAEWLAVPANLVAAVPDHVDPKEAAFAGLGAIAIHALRMADLRFGESVLVVGLGILGNLIAQIAQAAAYRTVGLDVRGDRVAMLQERGLAHVYQSQAEMEERLLDAVGRFGADAVLHCASGPGGQLINSSLGWIRDRGKIVIVGDLTAEFSRELMFGKEAQVLISRAGGPGRYDASYERENRDYPVGYVRWTEGRNVEEYIRLLAEGRISIKKLITNVYSFDEAVEAYENYRRPTETIGTVFKY